MIELEEPHVGLRVLAVGDDAAILDAPDEALHDRMVGAHHGKAVERHVLDEGEERVLHGREGLEVVEVLGVDIGDDRDVGRQLEEGAVGLVRLDHHPVARAEPRVGAVGVDDAAIDDGRDRNRSSSVATIEVVVVLPCVPAIATQRLSRISSASISARRTTGRRCARAAASSGLSRLIAVETTTTSASPRFSAACPTATLAPLSRSRFTLAESEASEPCTV